MSDPGRETPSKHTDTAEERTVTVRYFALLRDETGTSDEELRTRAKTPAELFEQLSERHDLDLNPDQLQVARNHEMSSWDASLKDGDTVAFLPPVSGG